MENKDNRYSNNIQCLNFLEEIIKEFPYLKFEQIISILDSQGSDYFSEEPDKTLARWKTTKLSKLIKK